MKNWYVWLPFLLGQFGFDFFGPGTFFGDVLAFIQGEIVAALAFLFNLLVAVTNFLEAQIGFTFNFFDRLSRDIKSIFHTIWDGITKITLARILSALKKLRKKIVEIVGKILCYFQAVRDILDFLFNKFIVPYLNMIRHIRQVLGIFRLLGFKWAARLDARLAKVENDLVSAYELVRIHLNQAVSFLQIIVDPFGIFRRNPLLAGVIRDAPEIKNAIDRATNHARTQKEQDSANQDNGWFQITGHRSTPVYFGGHATPQCPTGALQEFLNAVKELVGLSKQSLPTSNDGL